LPEPAASQRQSEHELGHQERLHLGELAEMERQGLQHECCEQRGPSEQPERIGDEVERET
jgi:hypothetical protein